MPMFTLAISCLTTSNLPWLMDLIFQVPMQYCSLQHQTLLLLPVTSTTGCCFFFDSIPSFFLVRLFFGYWDTWTIRKFWGLIPCLSHHLQILIFPPILRNNILLSNTNCYSLLGTFWWIRKFEVEDQDDNQLLFEVFCIVIIWRMSQAFLNY